MVAALVLLFIVVPLAELWVIVHVAHAIGYLDTFGLLILISAAGGWLMKREGLAVLRRAQAVLDRGEVPGKEMIDGVLILAGGALMLTPGFITDVFGVLLLLPPVRAGVRAAARRGLSRRVYYLG